MAENLYILGKSISHSKSPAMYNAAYEKLGLDWHYDFMDLPTSEAAQDFLRKREFLSINITTPYKPEALSAADVSGATAQLAGGANVLVNKGGKLIAYNVDGEGCVNFLELMGVNFDGARVAVCGTGPTAMSILHACVLAGAAEVTLFGRNKERSRAKMEAYLDKFHKMTVAAIAMPPSADGRLNYADAYERAAFKYAAYETSKGVLAAANVVIDATSLGMQAADPAPFDTSILHEGQVVMDTVYGHGLTATVEGARQAGARAFDGAGMLATQAVATLQIVADVAGANVPLSRKELFQIMSTAAGFTFPN
jgi:shikimate dehydrogenase